MHTIPPVVVKILPAELGKGTATRIVIVSEISSVERRLVNFGLLMEVHKSVTLQKKTVVIFVSSLTVRLSKRPLLLYPFVMNHVLIFFVNSGYFVFGVEGSGVCAKGEAIRDKASCKEACEALDMIQKDIIGNNECYKSSEGHCYQDGTHGSQASLICKTTENSRFKL